MRKAVGSKQVESRSLLCTLYMCIFVAAACCLAGSGAWLYCGGCISTSGKLVLFLPGGSKACQLKGRGVDCSSWTAAAKGGGR